MPNMAETAVTPVRETLPMGMLAEWECLRGVGEVRRRRGQLGDGRGLPRRRPQPPLAARISQGPERDPRVRRTRRRTPRPRP